MERRTKQLSVARHWIKKKSLKVFCFFHWVFLLYKTESKDGSDSDSPIFIGALGLKCNVSWKRQVCSIQKRREDFPASPQSLCSTRITTVYSHQMQWPQSLSMSSAQCLGELQNHVVWKGRALGRSYLWLQAESVLNSNLASQGFIQSGTGNLQGWSLHNLFG